LPNGLTNIYSSTKGDTIRITAGTIADTTYAAGSIKVTAINACGPSEEQTSAKAVTVLACSAALTITLANEDTIGVTKNEQLNIAVDADGKGDSDLEYRWQRSTTKEESSWLPTEDGTSNSYTVPTDVTGTFYYRCQVSNDCGTSTSDIYTVVVLPPCTGKAVLFGASKGPYLQAYTQTDLRGSLQEVEARFDSLRRERHLCLHAVQGNDGWSASANVCYALKDDVDYPKTDPPHPLGWRLPTPVELGLSGLDFDDGDYWTDAKYPEPNPYHWAFFWRIPDSVLIVTGDAKSTVKYRCVRTLE
jgi:hypothetical protein